MCPERTLHLLAGAPGFEPGNGGIKIHLVRFVRQGAFRKIAALRPQCVQEVGGHFGMPGSIPDILELRNLDANRLAKSPAGRRYRPAQSSSFRFSPGVRLQKDYSATKLLPARFFPSK
jgi:hypothetical protein